MRNKLQYTVYGFALIFFLSACGGPLNKSVTEPLTLEEVEEIVKKYDDFKYEYEHKIFPKMEKMTDNSLERQQYEKLTYGDYMKFNEFRLHNNWEEQFNHEWDQRFDDEKLTKQLDSMMDSIIGYWDNYVIENAPSTYVSIELIEFIKTVSESWSGKNLDASVRLKVTPLRGKIDKMSAKYTLYRTDKTEPDTYTMAEHLGAGKIEIENPFDAPVIVESKLSISDSWIGHWYDYVCDTSADVLKKKCKLYAPFPDLMIGGEHIEIMALLDKKPSCVYDYKETKRDTSSSEYKSNREEFIRKYIDKDYCAEKSVYTFKRKYQALYEYNSLAFFICFGEEGMRLVNN